MNTEHRMLRPVIFMAAFAVLQVCALMAAMQARAEDPFSVLFVLALLAPLFALAAVLSPAALLLVSPLLAIIPGIYLSFRIFEWVLITALAAAGLLAAAGRRRPRSPSVLEIMWALYFVWAIVSMSQAVDLGAALAGLRRIAFSGLGFVAGYRILGARHARTLLRMMSVLAVVIGIQLIVTIIVHGYSIDLLADRVVGLTDLGWGRSNYVAATASLGATCAIALTLFGSRWERVLGLAGILGAVIVQVTTLSRGGTVALIGGLLLAGLFEARRRLLPALTIAAGLSSIYFLSPLGRASLERFSGPAGLPSIGVRLLFFREALSVWRAHWLLGAGPDQIPFHTALYMDPNPHNVFLKHLADFGVVGLGLFLVLLLLAVRRAWRLRALAGNRFDRTVALALSLMLAVAILNASYEPTLEGSVYGYLFWLVVGALTRSADSATVNENPA